MHTLRLVNIRSFADSGEMEVSPITLLVGQNSSGKSTVVRFFPLLRQSAESLTREPLLWFGRFVDFGSADETKSKFVDREPFGADFVFPADRLALSRRRRGYLYNRVSSDVTPVRVSVRYVPRDSGSRRASAYHFSIGFFGQELFLDIQDNLVSKLRVNGVDYSTLLEAQPWLVPTWSSCFPNLSTADGTSSESSAFVRQIQAYVRSHTHGKSQTERVEQLARNLLGAPLDEMLKALRSPSSGDSTWLKTTAFWSENSPDFMRLRDWIIAARAAELIQFAATTFTNQCGKFRYIAPVRASAERYYRRQGLALGEIDPQGQNVAMFLHNLSASDRTKFADWMHRSFDFFVDTETSEGHTSMVIKDRAGSFAFNLADTGFGFSQMIPILMQMWMLSEATRPVIGGPPAVHVVALEQPELHLHPRLQAKLADLFIKAVQVARQNAIDLRIVIETHSEQIVNRIGKRIGEASLEREWVSLLLFEKSSFAEATSVTQTKYDQDGLLERWPYGFFEPEDQ